MTRRVLLAVLASVTWTGVASAEPPVREDYLLHCSGCHRMDGTGTPGVVPSLHTLGALLAAPGGRDYVGSVPGVAQAPLDDARLARLLNWVSETFANARPVPPFAAEEVATLRGAPLRDTAGARARLGLGLGLR